MKTILVVEDEFAIAELLRAALAEEGYRVLLARNGEEALNVLAEERPDLILSDVMMPVVDGRELYKIMQSEPAYRSIPIIVMSAGQKLHGSELFDSVAFLQKPFSLDNLFGTIDAVINRNGTG